MSKPELSEVYSELTSVLQILDLVLDDLHGCLKMPEHYVPTMRKDEIVLHYQRDAIWDCMKMLEQIDPEECQPF